MSDVNIIISRQTGAVSRAGFGLILIVDNTVARDFAICADAAAVEAEGWATTSYAYKAAQAIFSQNPGVPSVAVVGFIGNLETGLNAVKETNNDWYFLACSEQDGASIATLSAWAQANKKLYFARPDEDSATVLTLAESLAGNDRTAFIFHKDTDGYVNNDVIDAGWQGKGAPYLPGQITWKFKTIAGFSAAGVTLAEQAAFDNVNVNTYVNKFGVLQTTEGKVLSGEYIDVIRSQDFIESRLAEGVMQLFTASDKVPMDTRGVALVEAVVTEVMELAVGQDIIKIVDGVPQYTVSTPDIGDVSSGDRADRHLPDVEFSFELAGAIHSTTIRGVITV